MVFDIKLANKRRAERARMGPADRARERAAEARILAEERAERAIAREYIDALQGELEGPVRPHSLTACRAVVGLGAQLGALVYSDMSGRPCIAVDNNLVGYIVEEANTPDDVVEHIDPHIDELLVELAEALGCRWAWCDGDPVPHAITLVVAPAFVHPEREAAQR